MLSIKSKIILAYTVVFGVMLTIFAFIIYHSTKQEAFLKLNTNLKAYSISLRTEMQDEFEDESLLNMKKLNSIKAKGLIGERFQLFDDEGNVIVKDSLLAMGPGPDIARLQEESFKYDRKIVDGKKYHILWNRFETAGDTIYILETAASVKDVFDELDKLFYLFLIIIPAGLILTGFAAYFISKAAFKPITKMAETAKNISGESLERRLELPRAKDEVRSLGETLNQMIERIDGAFQSQKRFVANASHEIRTPLTVIQTELEILEKRIKDDDSKESIKNALSEIEDLNRLTASLLMIAKLDSSQNKMVLSNVRMDELLADCVQAMNPSAIKKYSQINLLIDDAVEINADKEMLRSVFLNLIDNAIKYSPDNSSISVKLDKLSGIKIKISIQNTGPGIPSKDLPYIFNRFYRSDEIRSEVNGSGLGLAIAKEIVELHRGEITAESKVGDITIFSVILPCNNT